MWCHLPVGHSQRFGSKREWVEGFQTGDPSLCNSIFTQEVGDGLSQCLGALDLTITLQGRTVYGAFETRGR